MFANKKGITLMELLIAIAILGTGLASIIAMMNAGITYVDRSRQEILAINLAREGVEGVYQIRNSNWLRWGGDKDSCWLKRDPMIDEGVDGCGDDARMSNENYILVKEVSPSNQYYFVLSGAPAADFDIAQYDPGIDDQYTLCFGTGQGWYACPGQLQPRTEGMFFRQIKGLGLYEKDTSTVGGNLLNCTTSETNTYCNDGTAKEYRFCSKVGYIKNINGDVELCGILTNFED